MFLEKKHKNNINSKMLLKEPFMTSNKILWFTLRPFFNIKPNI